MSELNLQIDNEKCIHCGLCINDCTACALEFNENQVPQVAQGGEGRCIKCQHCFSICPTGALSIFGKKPENSELVNHNIDTEQVLNLIKSRRSFRNYKQENLPKETLSKIKNVLHWVPTGCNFHDMQFSFIDDIEVMNEFRDYLNNQLINILSKKPVKGILSRLSRHLNALLNGEDVIFRGAPHMVAVSIPTNAPCADIDPIIALSYFELYAQSLGVGTVWCGLGHMCLLAFPELCEKLQIPENHKVAYVMLFGPANIKYTRTPQPEPYKVVSASKGKIQPSTFMGKIKRYLRNIK